MKLETKANKEIVRKAMSILGKRMTPKRLKACRKSAALMRERIKPRKLNAAAVMDIRLSGTEWKTTLALAKKYKVNPTTILRTQRWIYHAKV